MTCEAQGSAGKEFNQIRKEIEPLIIDLLKSHDYGNSVKDLAVIPIIMTAQPELERDGFFKERVLFKKKVGEADCRLKIDYEDFMTADFTTKRNLIISNIVQSIREIAKKAKEDFAYEQLEQDILRLMDVNLKELNLP
jgi:hypothetical protein